jgi:hypothetical protein
MFLASNEWVDEHFIIVNVFTWTLEIDSILVLMAFEISFAPLFDQLDN